MKPVFYYSPITCSTASHIILEESELPYERCFINITDGKHRDSDYIKLNPKGAIPALSLGDGILTENQAILTFVADQVPHKNLIPNVGKTERYRAHEWMNYCAASLHSYARAIFRPAAYAGSNEKAAASVRAHALKNMTEACKIVESKLPEDNWAVGDSFTVADAYLFIMYIWSRDKRMGEMPICKKWRALAKQVYTRETVKKIINIELQDRADYIFPTLD